MSNSAQPERRISAAWMVGRVGGLAVALGVGAGLFVGMGVACADSASPDSAASSDSTRATDASAGPSAGAGPRSTPRNRRAQAGPRASAASADDGPEPAQTVSANTVVQRRSTVDVPHAPEEPVVPQAMAAAGVPPADSVSPSPAGGDPASPVESPLPSALLAAASRREAASTPPPSAAVSTAQAASAAQAGTNGQVSAPAPQASAEASQVGNSLYQITVDPEVQWGGTFRGKQYPGILVGTLNAQSPLPLVYTLVSDPSLGGKLGSKANTSPQNIVFGDRGEFFYIPDQTALTNPGNPETFKILVAQQTALDNALAALPVIGRFMPKILVALHQMPLISRLLAPLIGAAEVVTFTPNAYQLATDPDDPEAQRATAFTTMVESFDGLMVSTNYYPATDVALGLVDSAPTVLQGPGLGAPGNTDVSNPYAQLSLFPWADPPTPRRDQFGSLTPGLPVLRDGTWISPDDGPNYVGPGYNVITWDPRGEWDTRDRALPGLQIDNPFFEGRDASAVISWAYSSANSAQAQVKMESPDDPLIGMTGGSYGGGIQWVTATTDPRVDVIIPQISWHSLMSALYPNSNQFKTGWGSVLALVLAGTGANINSQIYKGIGTGVTTGWLSESSQAVLSSSGPTSLLNKLDIPTLIFQGMEDGLFQLQESVNNAEMIHGNVPTKMTWFCGGHGTCLYPLNVWQDDRGLVDNLKWLGEYLAGSEIGDAIPVFQWYDQNGDYHFSDKLPFEPGFNQPLPYSTTGTGGLLGVWPLIGGSGPGFVPDVSPLLTMGNATPARNALNVTVTPPDGSQVVGAPTISFTYRGIGSTRTLYAQLIDNTTGTVLGNLVTPIPVEFDGKEHTATIPMANIGYTAGQGTTMTLQITSSATNFENFTSYGLVNISDIKLDLPIRA